MMSMGIDLEQPSREHPGENTIYNANGGNDRSRIIVEPHNLAKNSNDLEPTVSGRVFGGTDKVFTRDGINLNTSKTLEPHDEMEFESKEEAFSFYKDYARSVGFSTIIKASRRSRISGKFIDAKFVCTRFGTKREDSLSEMPCPSTEIPIKKKRGKTNRSWSKTDCKACMHVKRRQLDGRWVVRSFVKEHNHEIFLDKANYFHGCRSSDHGTRGKTGKVVVSSGGQRKNQNQKSSATNQSSCSEYLGLDEGDAQIMLDYFTIKQDENPNFFYAMDLNKEHRLRNVFWVDAKARLDYGYFGDAIFFDTSYIKNEYKLPFIPFYGVNHHFQGLLLGCALVASRTKSTYVWLFRAWLRAMGGHAPRVILTDQDKCLKEAIAEVFPNSHHCFCLWHILSEIPEKLGFIIRQHENFMGRFNKCVFKSCTIEQFENRWWKMAERFGLRNDIWFLSLYEDRERWVPLYMRDKFLAGLSATQRSESVSSFFDKQLQRKTTLKEFLPQLKAVIREKFEEEAKADFESRHKQPGLKSPSPFGKQMATIYTHAIFKKFQIEVLGVVACHPKIECKDGETKTFSVQDFEGNRDLVVVSNERASQFSCTCRLFEFNGYLCRHILIVMQMSGMHSIPCRYILKRWTKDAKNGESASKLSKKVDSRFQRYNDLCRRVFKLGDEGSLSQEGYNIVFTALKTALRQCEELNHANETSGKDVSRNKQVQSESEVITIGMHESWQQLLNSSGFSRNDCYSNQHGLQRLGQLNAIAPVHDSHYSSQQRMQDTDQSTPQFEVNASKHIQCKHLSQ